MKKVWLLALVVLTIYSCKPEKRPVKLAGEAQGTYYSIIYYDQHNRNFKPEIDSLLDAFDRSVSLWVPNSILSKVNRNDTTKVDKWFSDNFKISKEVYKSTGGAFDCTVEPVVKAWGFGFDEKVDVSKHIIDSLMQFVGFDKIKLVGNQVKKTDPRVKLDFNAIAQGYSVDLVGEFLENKGIENYLVDIGGEVKAKGTKPGGKLWRVGIEKPAKNKNSERKLKLIIGLKDKSVATSGSYRKYYERNGVRYSHTIDPKTGYPVKHSLLSVSVVTDNTAVADAYATAFMVMGFDKAKKFVERTKNMDAFFIYSDPKTGHNITYATEGFKKLILEKVE